MESAEGNLLTVRNSISSKVNQYEIISVYGYCLDEFYKSNGDKDYHSNGGGRMATIGYVYDNEFDYNYLYLTKNNELLVRENADSGGKLYKFNYEKRSYSDYKSYQYYLDSTNYKGNNSDIIDSNTLPWRELTEFSSDLDKAESNTTTKATTEKSTTEKATQSTAKHLDEDWVSLDQLKSKIGNKFTSGNGIEYTVIAIEDNYDAGGTRERLVLKSQNGDKMVIDNMPGFLYDEKKGNYYEITKYYSDSDYKTRQ